MPKPTDTQKEALLAALAEVNVYSAEDLTRFLDVVQGEARLSPPFPEPGADATLDYSIEDAIAATCPHDEAFTWCAACGAALARPTPALDVEGLINDLYDAIFAIPIREVDPDTGKVTPADPEEVRDAALGAVILARLAARATEGGTDR